MTNINIPVSVLNLAPIREGQGPKDAIDSMVDLAQATEQMGYTRYWIAEHHNTSTLVSSATSILIKHTLDNTEKIRVGSGGVMLPNHSPLVVAEQFGTMETIYPGRLDLGLGRAPGTDMMTASALRRTSTQENVYTFPEDVQQLLTYFGPADEQGYVKAHPGVGTGIPLYILGSSTDSAYLAAKLGLPYAFASHFAPRHMEEALEIYRRRFQSSKYLDKPHAIVCLNVIAADTDEEAKRESTTMQQFFLNVVRGTQKPMSQPVDDMDAIWTDQEKQIASSMTSVALMGSKETVKGQLTKFQEKYNADEIMAVSYIYDEEKLKRSYQIFKEIVDGK